MLKKLTSDQLIPGKKYLVEMELKAKDQSHGLPYFFADVQNSPKFLPADQPIYALEPTPEFATLEVREDNEKLKMLVEVASRLYTDPTFEGGVNEAAILALDLINACKNELNQHP